MRLGKRLTLVIILTGMMMLAGCFQGEESVSPQIADGVLDLTDYDLDHALPLNLTGKWELYWEELILHGDLPQKEPDTYVLVPDTWDRHSLNGISLPGQGYCTYRLQVKTDLPAGHLLGLKLHGFFSAYKLYINERLITTVGQVADTPAAEVGRYRPQAVIFAIPAPEFDILIQVSNFHYDRGGFWSPMYLGSAAGIMELNSTIIGKQLFLKGALLIISFFYFAVFLLRRELRYTLYFALLCLTMAVGIDMLGEHIIWRLFPALTIHCITLIWYSVILWAVFFLILYARALFPSPFADRVYKYSIVVVALLQLIYLLTPMTFYTKLAHTTNYLELFGLFCVLIIFGIGFARKKPGSREQLIAVAILLISYTHDLLYWTNVIRSSFGETFHLGLFVFMLMQMVIQARRIKLYHADMVAAELAFMQAQIKPHFLYNALNTFVAISLYDMEKARKLITDFGNYLRRSFDFRDLSQFAPLKHELELVKSYLAIEKARFEERIEVVYELPDDLEARVPILMLQPVVENGVIHGILPQAEGGRIGICITREKKALHFKVWDSGVGMEPEQVSNILDKHRPGSGVGLFNINNRLKKMFGVGLKIKSTPGAGTAVSWSIPLK